MLKKAPGYLEKKGKTGKFVLRFIYFFWNSFKRIRDGIILSGYSSRTIADYFRKQGAQIGEDCEFFITMLGLEPFLVNIGNHVFVSEGVMFHTHDGGVWLFRDKYPGIRNYGRITIEDNCLIGRQVDILPGITIGRNSIVGAGSVVISDVPPNSIVMGVPARVISSFPKYEEKCIANWKEQKPPELPAEIDYGWWTSRKNQGILKNHLANLFTEQDRQKRESEEED